jgi:hypothetical protein
MNIELAGSVIPAPMIAFFGKDFAQKFKSGERFPPNWEDLIKEALPSYVFLIIHQAMLLLLISHSLPFSFQS